MPRGAPAPALFMAAVGMATNLPLEPERAAVDMESQLTGPVELDMAIPEQATLAAPVSSVMAPEVVLLQAQDNLASPA